MNNCRYTRAVFRQVVIVQIITIHYQSRKTKGVPNLTDSRISPSSVCMKHQRLWSLDCQVEDHLHCMEPQGMFLKSSAVHDWPQAFSLPSSLSLEESDHLWQPKVYRAGTKKTRNFFWTAAAHLSDLTVEEHHGRLVFPVSCCYYQMPPAVLRYCLFFLR